MKAEWVLTMLALIPSVILHEVAHGASALAFGDDTAKRAGRLTLNPVPHIDPFGTLLLPVLLALSGLGAFGWAKPVPVNPRKLRRPRDQSLLVSLAGPATNVAIAVGAAAWFAFRPEATPALASIDTDLVSAADGFVFYLGLVNVLLAAFNLIPIPPLDGSALIERVLPRSAWPSWLRFRQYSMGILMILVLAVPGALDFVFRPALELWARLL